MPHISRSRDLNRAQMKRVWPVAQRQNNDRRSERQYLVNLQRQPRSETRGVRGSSSRDVHFSRRRKAVRRGRGNCASQTLVKNQHPGIIEIPVAMVVPGILVAAWPSRQSIAHDGSDRIQERRRETGDFHLLRSPVVQEVRFVVAASFDFGSADEVLDRTIIHRIICPRRRGGNHR